MSSLRGKMWMLLFCVRILMTIILSQAQDSPTHCHIKESTQFVKQDQIIVEKLFQFNEIQQLFHIYEQLLGFRLKSLSNVSVEVPGLYTALLLLQPYHLTSIPNIPLGSTTFLLEEPGYY